MNEKTEKIEKNISSIIDKARLEIEKEMSVQYPDIKHDEGKKLRGSLAVIVSDCLGGDHEKAVKYGSAVEFVHQGSIIHDDILDEHVSRRNKPSRIITDGIKKALLTGDIMFTKAISIGAHGGSEEAKSVAKAMESVLRGAIKEASIDNLLDDILTGRVEDELYYKIIDMKTAALFACSAQFGAMSFTDKKDITEDFFEYGLLVGEAYQIADDLVDIVNMADGKKDINPINVIPIIPAIIKYNKNFIKTFPFKALSGRIGLSTIMDGFSEMDISEKMTEDIKDKIKQADTVISPYIESTKEQCLLREYSKFAVNKMLDEIGEKL